MTFCELIVATLIGTLAGFVFAIVLFILQQLLQKLYNRRQLTRNLKREVKYNIELLNDWNTKLSRILEDISLKKKSTVYLKYSDFSLTFIGNAFQQGLLYDKLTNSELQRIASNSTNFNYTVEVQINTEIMKWNETLSDECNLTVFLQYQRDTVVRDLMSLLEKFYKSL